MKKDEPDSDLRARIDRLAFAYEKEGLHSPAAALRGSRSIGDIRETLDLLLRVGDDLSSAMRQAADIRKLLD